MLSCARAILPHGQPPASLVQVWAQRLLNGPAVLAVSASASERLEAFTCAKSCTNGMGFESYDFFDWTEAGPARALADRIQFLGGAPWEWVTHAIHSPDLVVEEPLRTFLDGGQSPATDVFRVIWEARHLRQEGRNTQVLLRTLGRWLRGAPLSHLEVSRLERFHLPASSEMQRLDALLCLVAVARHAGAFPRAVIVFDGLESVVNASNRSRLLELEQVCARVEVWGRMGSGLGLLVGCSTESTPHLRSLAPDLSSRLRLQA